MRRRAVVTAVAVLAVTGSCPAPAAAPDGAAEFRTAVEPLLADYCVRCHSGDAPKGSVALDRDAAALTADRDLWLRSLKMMRAGLMPPKGKDRPSAEETARLEAWVLGVVFRHDPKNPDPGHVTLRRLNRVEYRNTVRDLLGVDFDADAAFPPDDTGHGFDTIGDVLSLSPLLLEKYIAAAREIVGKAVPTTPRVPAEVRIPGRRFGPDGGDGPLALSYTKPATVRHAHEVAHAGQYRLLVDLTANETFVDNVFDYNKCRLTLKADGQTLLTQEFSRQGGKPYHFEFDQDWAAGKHDLTLQVEPLTPAEKPVRNLTLRLVAVTVRGPMEKDHWVRPANHQKFFPEAVPADPAGRQAVARTMLTAFANKAFRRPVDGETVDRLVGLVESHAARDGGTFEAGIAQAMTVLLASPRFLFREEGTLPAPAGVHPLVDEYALASRLSYFLWSTMPDEELTRLAREGTLRANLPAQTQRLLADPRSGELVKHFVGQWLQARGVDAVQINAAAVVSRDEPPDPKTQERRARFRELVRKPPEELTEAEKKELAEARKSFGGGFRRFAQFELTGDLRRAMRRETELTFDHVLRGDRSLLELVDADYTFLNERLAKVYGIDGVSGDQMRLVKLPADSPRGGLLTQASVLAVTSNPDRTSPVKRGLFILENLLGTPPPPAPPDIPALEEAETAVKGRPPTLREQLAAHRSQALCASCHNRMDPLGLAMENFNALGRWRDKDRGEPVEPAGELITGEKFGNVRELKIILATDRRLDFYRCLTEKMMVYALGRGLESYDLPAVDAIVARLDASGGKASVLTAGLIESAPFQKRRAPTSSPPPASHPGD